MTIWIKVRATAEQRDAWYEKARLKGVTFSELARHALDGTRVPRRHQLRRIEPELLRQLARLGNNLNQLARWANRDQRYAESAAVLARLVEIDRELAALRKLYEVPVLEDGRGGAETSARAVSKGALTGAANGGPRDLETASDLDPKPTSDRPSESGQNSSFDLLSKPVPETDQNDSFKTSSKGPSETAVEVGVGQGGEHCVEGYPEGDGGRASASHPPASLAASGAPFAGEDEGRLGGGVRTHTHSAAPVERAGAALASGDPDAVPGSPSGAPTEPPARSVTSITSATTSRPPDAG